MKKLVCGSIEAEKLGNRPTSGCTALARISTEHSGNHRRASRFFFLGGYVGLLFGLSFCFETVSHTVAEACLELPT